MRVLNKWVVLFWIATSCFASDVVISSDYPSAIFVDGQYAGSVVDGRYVVRNVSPGQHTIILQDLRTGETQAHRITAQVFQNSPNFVVNQVPGYWAAYGPPQTYRQSYPNPQHYWTRRHHGRNHVEDTRGFSFIINIR